MASQIIVSDLKTLGQNFAENSKQVLCSASFGAGAYAIGGRLLGLPPLTVPAALVTSGALVAALALCPSGANSDKILGPAPGFSGGQCPVNYTVSVRFQWVGATSGSVYAASASRGTVGKGPFSGLKQVTAGRTAVARLTFADRVVDFGGQNFPAGEDLVIKNIVWENVSRVDGLPDNCGNPPRSGGQLISNNQQGDTIDNSKVINNENYTTVIPVVVNLGGINNTFNLKFGPIEIESLFPLNFNIDIGGMNFGFNSKPDGTLEPVSTNPDKTKPNNKLEKILSDIKSCVCKPDVDLDMLFLPLVDSVNDCDISSATFLVPKGSVSQALVDRFQTSAVLASERCEQIAPAQKEEVLLYAATVTVGGKELFTPLLDNDIVSLRVKITNFNENLLPPITSYPDSNQRKFGSVSYVGGNVQGGGDYIYVFDTDTYVPLPKRGKRGRLRLLFKPFVSFEVYDTGERY